MAAELQTIKETYLPIRSSGKNWTAIFLKFSCLKREFSKLASVNNKVTIIQLLPVLLCMTSTSPDL